MMRFNRWHDRPRAEMACAEPDAEPRRPLVGLRLALIVALSPLLAIGFLWVSYFAVKAVGVLLVIAQAVLS
jgi:hypothetical protein